MKSPSSRISARKGVILSMELVLVLPIFLVLIFSIVEFSMLMSAQTRVANAAQNGARMLSICGVPSASAEAEVKARVEQLLGPSLAYECVVTIEPGAYASDLGHVRVQVPMQNACPDLLWMTGFSVSQRTITCDAAMAMERTTAASAVELR
ncbi:MAG TPA: TadE/TadG family type IV pilus assembly protein [Planctomycetaceae bacterium]|nr:TadE/TadG family type IV pilus assembly protein [Planctomycetaceae bacterium]